MPKIDEYFLALLVLFPLILTEIQELCIFSSVDPTPLSDSVKNNVPLTFIKSFEKGRQKLKCMG